MQKWKKLGLLFQVSGDLPWRMSHAAVPTVQKLSDGQIRVYYSPRDKQQRSYIGTFEVNLAAPTRALAVATTPVLSPGELGCFDDSGVMPAWVMEREGKTFLYYIGWNLGVTVPFSNFTGLAIAERGSLDFKRYSPAPIANRDRHDPFFFTTPCLLWDGDHYKIWYIAAVKWELLDGKPHHHYLIKFDRSDDGIQWRREPKIAIPFQNGLEYAITRPCVIKESGLYKMWYSFREQLNQPFYRIGYAESKDGENWTRKDSEVGLTPSASGWDADSVEYAYVFDALNQRFMLYNGKEYGRTGIGIAVLEQD